MGVADVVHELMQWTREHGGYPGVTMGASAGGYAAADVATGTERTVMKGWTAWGDESIPSTYPLAADFASEWPRSWPTSAGTCTPRFAT